MASELAFAGRDYTVCINTLVNLSNRFLEASRQFNLRFVTAPAVPRLTMAVQLVRAAELQQVRDFEPHITELDYELDTLVKKFQLVQRSHQKDTALKNFLGDFSRDSEDAFKKLGYFVDDSIRLADSVITAYAQFERSKTPAKAWVSTILSPNTSSTKAMAAKAKSAQKTIAEVESVANDIRNLCQQTRSELNAIKNVVTKNLIRRAGVSAPSAFAQAGKEAANRFYSR